MTALQEMVAGLAIWLIVIFDMLRRCGIDRLDLWELFLFSTPFQVRLIWASMALLGMLMLWIGAARWM